VSIGQSKEIFIMRKPTFSVSALLLSLSLSVTPAAFAGATNSGDNKAATPGQESSNVKTPADGDANKRKGTTETDKHQTPQGSSDNQQASDQKQKNKSK
jgi:hypothetical protein